MRSRIFKISWLLFFTFIGFASAISANQDDFTRSGAAYHYSEAEKAFIKNDKILNEIYRQIMAGKLVNIEDTAGKKLLRESQREWIKFRDANCEMFGQVSGGASNWKAAYSMDCKAAMTKKRVDELKEIMSQAIVAAENDNRRLITEDVLSRMEPDFYFYKEKSRNVEKLLKDCTFQDVDLNDDGIAETVVKVNWLSDGSNGFSQGYNFVRGAHDSGAWHIYNVTNKKISYIGTIYGDRWVLLPAKSDGYKDIETWSHDSYKDYLIDVYKYSGGKYNKVSSMLYELNEDGTKKAIKKVYK